MDEETGRNDRLPRPREDTVSRVHSTECDRIHADYISRSLVKPEIRISLMMQELRRTLRISSHGLMQKATFFVYSLIQSART